MTKRRMWWGGAVVALAVAAGATFWAQRERDGAITYRSAKIERGSLAAAVSASGTLTPVTQVQISSQVSGQIKELFVDFNSEVKQGQLIARLDPETYEYRQRQSSADVEAARASVLTAQANVQHSMAQVSRAQVELQEARRDEERKRSLVAQNFISPAEGDTARAKVATLAESLKAAQAQVAVSRAQAANAQAIVRQREAALSQARVDLQRTQIRSPVDGIVIKRSVEVGQTVAASLQAPELFVIARNLSDMQVEASIDEADIARVRLGQKVNFTIDAFPGKTFEGQVKQVRKAALSAQNVVTYVVVVGFSNPGAVLPGMTASVRIVTDTREDVLKLPNAALRVRIPGVDADAPARAGANGFPAAVAHGAAPGGPLAEMRERLLRQLALSPQQTEAVDAIVASLRPRFAALRELPEEERAKAREPVLAELRARVAEQLSPEQQTKYQQMVAEQGGRQPTRGRVYLLGDDGKPRASNVQLGISDGAMTEVVGDAVKEGASVITAVVQPGAAGASERRPAMPRLPF